MLEGVYFANSQLSKVNISLTIEAPNPDQIQAKVVVNNRIDEGLATLHIAVFENDLVDQIFAGENKGETLHHDFVVRYWSKPFELTLQQSQHQQIVEIPISNDWKAHNLGVAAVVINKPGETLQSVSTPIDILFES